MRAVLAKERRRAATSNIVLAEGDQPINSHMMARHSPRRPQSRKFTDFHDRLLTLHSPPLATLSPLGSPTSRGWAGIRLVGL